MSATSTPDPAAFPSTAIGDLTNLGLRYNSPRTSAPWRVLIVGDGNFSFARAFLRNNASQIQEERALAVTATSLDTRDDLMTMYPNSTTILDELETGGVRVIHGINATKLESYPELVESGAEFDRIVFNFPHFAEGGNRRNKIHKHRELLVAFFASACGVLHREGQIWVTLCAGQGGTPADTKQRSWGDTWQVVHCAAGARLLLEDVHLCPVQRLSDLGYYSVGYQLRERPFWTVESLSHVFCHEGVGRRARFPIEWKRDMSFWINDAFTDTRFRRVLEEFFPVDRMTVTLVPLDTYHCTKTDRRAVTYRLEIASDIAALTKDEINERAVQALAAVEASEFADSRAN